MVPGARPPPAQPKVPVAPAKPVAGKPAARPVAPVAARPVAPASSEVAAAARPVAGKPAARPAAPVAARPVAPVAARRVAPASSEVAAAARPVAGKPAARPAAPVAARPAAPVAARPVAPGSSEARVAEVPVGPMERWSAQQILEGLRERLDAYAGVAYGMGTALAELARPERYRDELGFRSFEMMLQAYGLPSRMTAFKLIRVVGHFSLAEVRRLGGMEKTYYLLRIVLSADANADVREVLEPGARVAGLDVQTTSGRTLREALRGLRPTRQGGVAAGAAGGELMDHGAPSRAAQRLRTAVKYAVIPARIRVHYEDGVPCIAAHLDVAATIRLASCVRTGAHPPPPS